MANTLPAIFTGDLTTGTSPVTLLVREKLGAPVKGLVIVNFGSARFDVELSIGDSFGDFIPIEPRTAKPLKKLVGSDGRVMVDRVRLTRLNADSSYLVMGAEDEINYYFGDGQKVSLNSNIPAGIALNTSTSIKLLDANINRKTAIISNRGPGSIFLKLQAASVDNVKKGIFLESGDTWPEGIYKKEISAIAITGNPVVYPTEQLP